MLSFIMCLFDGGRDIMWCWWKQDVLCLYRTQVTLSKWKQTSFYRQVFTVSV